ncbi:PREDICTED: uncharacterized protein LOC105592870 [Cercocebus atys]|uniref:uncharacterized protein LOC105592870 n=1 Tax=Cercocebus atys TaxID=9531 RepID=UPI0005F3CC54|nr:PREDICTED: uncharacterized protein LOC105592870 [Cercocebus atys]
MDKPRPGKTTFVIMVSPLPGKYELLYLRPATASYVSPFTGTVTCPAHSGALLALTHSWDSQVRPAVLNPLPRQGNAFVGKQQMSKQQPLRCLIYIEVAVSVMSPTVPFAVPVCLSSTQRTNPLPEPTRGSDVCLSLFSSAPASVLSQRSWCLTCVV